ncbi:unnamed protein product [Haemonchus placei]|uniref:Uncharacterized protein n=1 Tax=Haemonchus placei TaxID=6290 RepID=A0A3P7ZWS5_HAEPC|nr:unnamed protein product [Haemonchus placei]
MYRQMRIALCIVKDSLYTQFVYICLFKSDNTTLMEVRYISHLEHAKEYFKALWTWAEFHVLAIKLRIDFSFLLQEPFEEWMKQSLINEFANLLEWLNLDVALASSL